MSGPTEAFAQVKIDALLEDAGWNLTDGSSDLFEHALPDGTQADYVLCDRQGRSMAALEAKRASTDPIRAQDQGRHYAEQLGVPFVFLSNGEGVRFLDRETDAHAREIAGFYAPDDLERRIAARQVFGGEQSLGDLIAGLNSAVFGSGTGASQSEGGPTGRRRHRAHAPGASARH